MSFPALFLACQAVAHLEPLEDDEFGLAWADLGVTPTLNVTWVLYRSQGAGLVFGIRDVRQQSVGEFLDAVR